MTIKYLIWQGLVDDASIDTPELEIVYKDDHGFSRFIDKVFWKNYNKTFTTVWPKIYIADTSLDRQRHPAILQHELVHFWDQETFFGLLKFMPRRFNKWLFLLLYAMPQLFALLAILAFWYSNWWLLALLFLLPLPAPFRMISEMRSYRRSIELGDDLERTANAFTSLSYHMMWPFKKHVLRMLQKPSPYKERQSTMIRDILNRL